MRSFFPLPAASGLMMTAAHTCHSASFDFPTHVSIGVMNIPIHTGPGPCSPAEAFGTRAETDRARPNGGGTGCRQQTQIRQESTYLDIRGERGCQRLRNAIKLKGKVPVEQSVDQISGTSVSCVSQPLQSV
ncbi:hypothetical protein B0H13DRAFT_2090041, partial [Mycena leptocephala]